MATGSQGTPAPALAALHAIRNADAALDAIRTAVSQTSPDSRRSTLLSMPGSPRDSRLHVAMEAHQKAQATNMIYQRPRWLVMILGWFLACCAGFVNAVAFRSWGSYASHVTGITTSIAMRLEGFHQGKNELDTVGSALMTLVSFLFGAYACGLLIDKTHVHFGGKSLYGYALVGNAGLLMTAVAIADQGSLEAVCLTAAACGLQNAMCTSHFGAVIRTTHVTGTITDIGSTSGRLTIMLCRKRCAVRRMNALERAEVAVDARKLFVLFFLWCSFLTGGILGAYLESEFGVRALLIPAGYTLSVGLAYIVLRERMGKRLQAMEHARLGGDVEQMNAKLQSAMSVLTSLRTQSRLEEANAELDVDRVDEDDLVVDLARELGYMLENMRDIEESIELLRNHAENKRRGGACELSFASSAGGRV
eukprot:TRINITY_DN71956_c0_g1_i1.p1 TRINITY_DN71956_c0_g1~~TRINITY_DN71956_c0_g1_i1.p1  ORF type:complete len:449 (-),score=85.91 TRINITY_DN71956_c0_g1_i1:34-1296(-)